MKRIAVTLLCLLFGIGFVQPENDLEKVKERALEDARAVLNRPTYGYPPAYLKRSCPPEAKRLYSGKPVFVRSLIHPTPQDRRRLQRRIEEARKKRPDFVVTTLDDFYNWDSYRVPIFDRTCGYVFHIELNTDEKGSYRVSGPFQFTRQEAQRYLASAASPTLVGGLPSPEEKMWVAGFKAIDAFGKRGSPTIYRIVDTSGKPVSPLEAKLKLYISWQPFTLTDGTPSAFWVFLLPVRLEPLPQAKSR